MPRVCKLWVKASAVYFFPTAQSVPTIRTRFPVRFMALPMGSCAGGTRTLTSCAPVCCAALARPGISSSRKCKPLTISSPRFAASIMVSVQRWSTLPPTGATPISRLLTPAFAACSRVISGTPKSSVLPAKRNWPATRSGHHCIMPRAVLA